MELLMPLFIKVASSLGYISSVHDMQNFISNCLTVSTSFSDKSKHGSEKVGCRQEMLGGISILV